MIPAQLLTTGGYFTSALAALNIVDFLTDDTMHECAYCLDAPSFMPAGSLAEHSVLSVTHRDL